MSILGDLEAASTVEEENRKDPLQMSAGISLLSGKKRKSFPISASLYFCGFPKFSLWSILLFYN